MVINGGYNGLIMVNSHLSHMLDSCPKFPKWVCLKIGYIPNDIAIFHRDNDQQNHWVHRGLAYFQTHPYGSYGFLVFYHVYRCL